MYDKAELKTSPVLKYQYATIAVVAGISFLTGYLFRYSELSITPILEIVQRSPKTLYPDSIDGSRKLVADKEYETNCVDVEWCSIEMPKESYFKFDPPNDINRWKLARYQASKGFPLILQENLKVFTNPFEFIDGDIQFRSMHYIPDFFVDTSTRDFSPLIKSNSLQSFRSGVSLKYNWEKQGIKVLPDNYYDFRSAKRAAIVKYGYFAFEKASGEMYYTGKVIGTSADYRPNLYRRWLRVKDKIDTPFIFLHSHNENYGILSTYFPNRTVNWGICCGGSEDKKYLQQFLDHNMTLMMLTNQHTNVTHPNLLTLPRGIPGPDEFSRKMIWDTMRLHAESGVKNRLLFTASSSWGPRPQIIKCVSKKFTSHEFEGMYAGPELKNQSIGRIDKLTYYSKLIGAKFSLAVPGLGYDTYRLWESMVMGVIPVLEQNVGFDRTLWRLPALLVEDFDVVTPDLLRKAYIEALYRVKEFEYKRLTQKFWNDFIWNVSVSLSAKPLEDLFPMKAVDTEFTRPAVPYDCSNGCGPGTKRTPKSYC